jgi:hypothetical protein
MALEVVWRNPIPRLRTVKRIELAELDDGKSIYIVHGPDAEAVFELIAGGCIALPQKRSA